jgi:IS1 family transposase
MSNVLSKEKRTAVLRCLVEGNGIRATCRITGVCKPAVLRLLELVGNACRDYQDKTLRNLQCGRLECDEAWSYVFCKQQNLPPSERGYGKGDVWTWTAIDPDSKLVVWWHVGMREATDSILFMESVASRLANRVQLTTDGFTGYKRAVENAFGANVDFGTEVKVFQPSSLSASTSRSDARYSPSRIKETERKTIIGKPDSSRITISHNERNNLTMRMQMRRFTRLTNGFSKKIENHAHAIALHFMNYNFCQIHGSIRATPAMAAGVTDHVWGLEEVVALLDRP